MGVSYWLDSMAKLPSDERQGLCTGQIFHSLHGCGGRWWKANCDELALEPCVCLPSVDSKSLVDFAQPFQIPGCVSSFLSKGVRFGGESEFLWSSHFVTSIFVS